MKEEEMVMRYLVAILAVSILTLGGVDNAFSSDVLEYFKDAGRTERSLRRDAARQELQQRRAARREQAQQDLEQRQQKNRALKAEHEEKRKAFKAEMAEKAAAEKRRFNSLTPEQQKKEREQELAREKEMERAVDGFFRVMGSGGGGGGGYDAIEDMRMREIERGQR